MKILKDFIYYIEASRYFGKKQDKNYQDNKSILFTDIILIILINLYRIFKWILFNRVSLVVYHILAFVGLIWSFHLVYLMQVSIYKSSFAEIIIPQGVYKVPIAFYKYLVLAIIYIIPYIFVFFIYMVVAAIICSIWIHLYSKDHY